MEEACNEAERAVTRLKFLQAASSSSSSCTSSSREESQAPSDSESKHAHFDIFKELQKLRDEEESDSSCDEEDQEIQYRPLILDKLVKKEQLNTVILNLYAANKGYSLGFRMHDRKTMRFKEEIIETKLRSYEETAVLRHIHNEQIPPLLLEALEKYDFLFYNGCVILEVRNHCLTFPSGSCYVHHVLLRPTQQTVLADINTLTRDRPEFTAEDRDVLESQIVMAQTPDLCLDPDPDLEDRVTAINNRTRLWHAGPFVRMATKSVKVAVNRKRKCDEPIPGLQLLAFCRAKKARMSATKSNKAVQSEETNTVIPAPKFEELALAPPSKPIVMNKFKALDRPEVTSDCTLYRIEDHVLETDIPEEKPRLYHTTLSILYRPSNMDFFGEVYLDRDFNLGQRAGLISRFRLGTRAMAHRYVFQFTELFTDSGRKNNVRVQSKYHLHDPEEVILPPNASHLTRQRLSNLKEHIARLNRAIHALSSQKEINLNELASGIYSGDFEQSDLYASRSHTQKSIPMTREEQEINDLATKLELSAQPFDAAEKANRQAAAAAQQKQLAHPNMINLLHSSPVSNVNSNASAAVASAVHSAGLAQQRLLTRRATLNSVTADDTRVVSQNLVSLNNRSRLSAPQTFTLSSISNATRMNLGTLNSRQQNQTVTLTSMSNAGGSFSFTTVPAKHQQQNQQGQNQRNSGSYAHPEGSSESALGALLVGTPAADRPEIASPNHANSLLLEKFAPNPAGYGQSGKTPQGTTQQFVLQTSKANSVISSLSIPTAQSSSTVNVQSLNLSQLQSIPGLHNVQLPNFAQPISLAVNVGSQISGATAPQGIVMTMPGTQTQQRLAAQGSSGQPIQGMVMNAGNTSAGSSTLAHLVTSGPMKNRRITSGAQTLQLTANHSQLISQLQRTPRQANVMPNQAVISGRSLQRTATTHKMAPNPNKTQTELEAVQHYQQRLVSQNGLEGVFDKLRKSSGGGD
ncbi:hypothetical protein HUJ04_009585 [Dendroctonus ponderosae]|nr:hypothetical protein HUJ04_009585 [Dendroctonus ponderosae]